MANREITLSNIKKLVRDGGGESNTIPCNSPIVCVRDTEITTDPEMVSVVGEKRTLFDGKRTVLAGTKARYRGFGMDPKTFSLIYSGQIYTALVEDWQPD